MRVVFAGFLVLAACVACGENSENPAQQQDSGTSVPADSAQENDSGAADTGASTEPFFELGNNTTGKSTPDHFFPVADGDKLNVELGPQGLWMVVLAFRTKALMTPPLVLTGRVEMDGELLGELKLGKQKLLPGPKGVSYYYNFFLVVAPEGVANNEALVRFVASDPSGEKVNLTRKVILTGGK